MAFSRCMASSNVHTPRTIGKNASMPLSLHAAASFVTEPANAITLQPYFLAALATPHGRFSHCSLKIQPSLSGEHNLRFLCLLLKMDHV